MYNRFYPPRRGNRFGLGRGFGNDFFVPFVLGGIAGSLWNNRPIVFYPTPFQYYPYH